MVLALDIVLEGFKLPESPRWHDGRLWMSDIIGRRVGYVDAGGQFETVVEIPTRPSGLGWDDDGNLLIVSQSNTHLLRFDGDSLSVVSDHTAVARPGSAADDVMTNDMVVDGRGFAYISSFSRSRENVSPIILVTKEGAARVVSYACKNPNGMVISADGKSLVVAENAANRLTHFTVTPDGDLTDGRVFADLGAPPDGLCMDAEGGVWTACPRGHEVLRVMDGGRVADRLDLGSRMPLACMLGGPDRMDLYVMTVEQIDQTGATSTGRVEMTRVTTPGVGLP